VLSVCPLNEPAAAIKIRITLARSLTIQSPAIHYKEKLGGVTLNSMTGWNLPMSGDAEGAKPVPSVLRLRQITHPGGPSG